jgi:hypothetical protein
MSDVAAHRFQTHLPIRFVERGVAAPFTTPHLQGARIRASGRGGIDYLLPNPAGRRGVYVVDWGGVRQLGPPTLHDTLLHQRLPSSGPITPEAMRQIGQAIAIEGAAGRLARTAAMRARQQDQESLTLAHFLLTLSLIEQQEPTGRVVAETTPRDQALDDQARHIAARVGPSVGRSVGQVADDLEGVAALFAALGVEPTSRQPRLARLLARMWAVRSAMLAFPDESGSASALARTIAIQADVAATLIDAVRVRVADMADLLRAWIEQPSAITERASRPAWVLDGWDQLCLLWETADSPAQRQVAIVDMAGMAPALPREVLDWTAPPLRPEVLEPPRRPAGPGRRTGGAQFHTIARQEQLRALLS